MCAYLKVAKAVANYVVSFSPLKLVEYPDVRRFAEKAGRWMEIREAENCYLLSNLPWQIAKAKATGGPIQDRFFAVQERDTIVGTAVLFEGGSLCLSWLSEEMIAVAANGLYESGSAVQTIFGPGYVSWKTAEGLAGLTGNRYATRRAERLYELTHVVYRPQADGRLEKATTQDLATIKPWIAAFVQETDYADQSRTPEQLAEVLVKEGQLFLWKSPHAVAMAGWAMPTAHGISINYIYVPPEHRGNGYGKTMTAAMGKYLLSNGRRYCFILTDTADRRSNQIYQSIGARTLVEFLRCELVPTSGPKEFASAGTHGMVLQRERGSGVRPNAY